jgi:AraC-like DNA-binding protein
MTITLHPEGLILLILGCGAVLSGLFSGCMLLVRKTEKLPAHLTFGLLLLIGSFSLLHTLMSETGVFSLHTRYIIPAGLSFTLGPLIWFYVLFRLNPSHEWRKTDYLHLLLPAFQMAYYLFAGFMTLLNPDLLSENFANPVLHDLENAIFLISFLSYLLFAFELIRHSGNSSPSAWELKRYRWLRRLIEIAVALFAVSLITEAAQFIIPDLSGSGLYEIPWTRFPKNLASIGLIFWLAWHGFQNLFPEMIPDPEGDTNSEIRFNLSEADIHNTAARLRRFLKKEKPYLNQDLTLGLLAHEAGVSKKMLAFILAEGVGQSYADLINFERVEEAKRRLSDPARVHCSIRKLGIDCGFSSKSAFRFVFHEYTGEFPEEFRATRKEEPNPSEERRNSELV